MSTRVKDFSGSMSMPTPQVAQENTPLPVGIIGIPALSLFQLCANAFLSTTFEVVKDSDEELGPPSVELFDGFVTLNFKIRQVFNLIF